MIENVCYPITYGEKTIEKLIKHIIEIELGNDELSENRHLNEENNVTEIQIQEFKEINTTKHLL